MKTLDKKLFVGLKYLIILIPLFLFLYYTILPFFIGHEVTKLLATEQNENVWQYRDNQYDEYEGGYVMDLWVNSIPNGSYNPEYALTRSVNAVYNWLPKITTRIQNTTKDTDPLTLALAKVSNKANTTTNFANFENSVYGSLIHYMYYVIIVELVWVLIVLFKWFIQFGYGLFEKERKL